MPSVAEELAALRKQSLTKAHASKLKDANGLSTPQQEEEALKEAKNKTSLKTYTKDAVETLNKGTNAVDQDMQVRLQQSALKKQDMEKKKEAAKNLQAFKGGAPATAPVTPSSPAPAVASSPSATSAPSATSSPAAIPAPVPPSASPSTADADDIPDLDEMPQTVSSVDEDEDEDAVPEMMSFDPATASSSAMAPRVPNRAEKKARKIMERLGMKSITGISRVTLKMNGNQGFFTIFQPDVYEKSGSYIVFGEARQGSGIPPPQAQAAKQVTAPVASEKKVEAVAEVEEVVDETGVEAKDIELVVSQVGCSRAKAVKALKQNGGDLVNAIMSLTT